MTASHGARRAQFFIRGRCAFWGVWLRLILLSHPETGARFHPIRIRFAKWRGPGLPSGVPGVVSPALSDVNSSARALTPR